MAGYDSFDIDVMEAAAYGARTQDIGENIVGQASSSLRDVESLSTGWNGSARGAFDGLEVFRKQAWDQTHGRYQGMSDSILQTGRNHTDYDDQASQTIISDVI